MTKKEKLKKFWDENRKYFMVGGLILLGGAAGIASTWYGCNKRFKMIPNEDRVMYWHEDGPIGTFSLEKIQKLLDINKDGDGKFIIIKEAIKQDNGAYSVVIFNDLVKKDIDV